MRHPSSLLAALLIFAGPACRAGEDAATKASTASSPSDAVESDSGPEPTDTEASPNAPRDKPKLVVVVVVDQMRADYLERFAEDFEGGFARLRSEARVFTQARHLHGMTETAPGHATISTGTHPSRHGIIANSWYDPAIGAKINAIDDAGARDLVSQESGSASPIMLLRDGVGDWLQAEQPDAVVVSISLKDRAAILMGGKRPDIALWYNDAAGAFTSSSYYGEALPQWVSVYNALDRGAALYGAQGWTLRDAPEAYAKSRARTDPNYVTTYNDYALTKQFPHVIEAEGKAPRNVVRDTPFGDQMSLELARAAIENEHMGQDEIPDLLFLSMSGGDYAGHRYGPQSVEIHDYYLRLDAQLGTFMQDLDERVGKDNYVFVLTADHGVAPMPEYSDIETAGRFVGGQEMPALLASAAEAMGLDAKAVPEFVYTHGAYLQFPNTVDTDTRARFLVQLARSAQAHPRLAQAWTREQLLAADPTDTFVAAQRHSYHPERSPDLIVQFERGVTPYPKGTNHGTPYTYDQHVPLLVLGAGAPGPHSAPVATTDIAPSLARLVGIEAPEDIDGQALALEYLAHRQTSEIPPT